MTPGGQVGEAKRPETIPARRVAWAFGSVARLVGHLGSPYAFSREERHHLEHDMRITVPGGRVHAIVTK
jgi:hypothetical protein